MLEELLLYLGQSLVNDPASVRVCSRAGENGIVVYEMRVDGAEMGRVIGKHGRIAKAIRSVMKAAANRTGQKIQVEIAE